MKNGVLPLVSVRSDRPIPKNRLAEAAAYLRGFELEAPVGFHDTVCKNILDLNADIISTREIVSRSIALPEPL